MIHRHLHNGREVVWGMPGLREVPIHDCVVASCSLPGVFPPKKIYHYYFVDGSVVDTLPIKVAAYHGSDIIIASYLQSDRSFRGKGVQEAGLGSIFEQALSIWSKNLTRHNLNFFENEPLVLIEPKIWNHGLFEFRKTKEVIRQGERATDVVLANHRLLPSLRRPGLAVETPLPEDLPKYTEQEKRNE